MTQQEDTKELVKDQKGEQVPISSGSTDLQESTGFIEDFATSPPSRAQKILRIIGWVSFALLCLCLFTFFKLPRERLKAYIDGNISSVLAERGISYSAKESDLSFLFGVTYQLKDVELYFPPPAPKVKFQELRVSPSLFSSLFGRYKAKIKLVDSNGYLDAWVSNKNTQYSVIFEAKDLDLGKLAVLPIVAGIQGGAIVTGEGSVSTDTMDLTTTNGSFALRIKKLVLDSQTVMGFPVPKIAISESTADAQIENGKIQIKTLKLGKPGNAEDDIQGNITGSLTLGRHWMTSKIDLNTRFSLSQAIMKPLVLLDALLGSGKQSDGSYAFHLTGPLLSPTPSPLEPGH